MSYCTNCGTDLADGVRYCTSCGTAVSPRASPSVGGTGAGMNDSASRLAESYITQALEAVSQQDTARATQLVDRALLAQPTNQEALNLRAQLTGTAPSAARPISAPTAASPPSAYYGAPAGAPTQGGAPCHSQRQSARASRSTPISAVERLGPSSGGGPCSL